MDFFERQDHARRTTKWLVLLFLLAVACLIVGIYVVLRVVLITQGVEVTPNGETAPGQFWDPYLLGIVAFATGLVVGTGSLYKSMQLSQGGRVVAELLGGRKLDPASRDPGERRLLNVVEEMSLASGIPVPSVYMLDGEKGINAFAAGLTTSDAVIGVTRGAVDLLTREELQGVIGHEFSHVLNGDMRINVRLMGIIHGILLISMIGYIMMRASAGGRSRRKEGGAIVIIGIALLVLGYAGVFFGRLIQAAVSRQREYLADAAAVQFTRNPGSLAGALKKIGGLSHGSRVENPHAQEARHFFFSGAFGSTLFQIMATHPPLPQRIRRLDPTFDGKYPEVRPPQTAAAESQATEKPESSKERMERMLRTSILGAAAGANPASVIDQVGTLTAVHVAYVEELMGRLEPTIRESVHEPLGAEAVVYALLLDRNPEIRQRQLASLEGLVEPPVLEEIRRQQPRVDATEPAARLPLIDMALPALRGLSPEQFRRFSDAVRGLVQADKRISLFEYTLQRIVLRHLTPHFQGVAATPVHYYSLNRLQSEVNVVLSAFANLGHSDPTEAEEAFNAGMKQVSDAGVVPQFLPTTETTLARIDEALGKLAQVSHPLRRKILLGAVATVAWDHEVTIQEGELLRAVADALEAPLPPLLPGQSAE